ncbi:MAG TPA: LacI family DNA-binding transcriptional regulator [Anaerolineae bacterium]|nr:LacI family DNA-binding transcriptional regulator [Anaerolineae bacterium]
MITMRDVADRAGVSATTVSHVINGTRFVSEEIRQRVLDAMRQLEYQPNALARSLRLGQTNTLGMIVPDSANPFFAEMAHAIEGASFSHGHNVILCNSEGDLSKELVYTNVLMEKQVDGIIFVAAGLSSQHILSIAERSVPVVVVDRGLPDIAVDTVMCDNKGGGYAATAHLIGLGHTRIGCISGPSTLTPSAGRVLGYRQALADSGLPVDENLIQQGDFQYSRSASAMARLLEQPEPPTAVFACNDMMAIAAISVANERGLRVPCELAVVGFDDVALASFISPPLTTVAQPTQQMAEKAIELLLARIDNQALPVQRLLLATHLVVRRSTAPLGGLYAR